MSEPDLIRNNSPHQVTLAEGTNVAVGKKADAAEPSVRKVLAETDGLVIEHSLQDDFVSLPDSALAKSEPEQPTFERQLKEVHAQLPAAVEAGEQKALLPESLPAEPPALVFVPAAPTVASPAQGPAFERSESDRLVEVPSLEAEKRLQPKVFASVQADEENEPKSIGMTDAQPLVLSEAMEAMLQMDFPARVVKLKIENDKVRTKLDGLQSSIRH